ncbi:retrovirus-related pol polyprotein from transposon TNT 1-94 [Tanacetum coccineum]
MVPRAVLMKSGLVSLNTARQVNIAHPKTIVNSARPMTNIFNKAHSNVRRPINNKTATKNSNQKVNTVRGNNVNTARPKAVVNVVKGNHVNAVKASACWVWKPKTKVLDHISKHNSASMNFKRFDYIDAQGRSNGCSRHMTRNMSYLTDFEEVDGGYVAFGGNPKGGKITGRCAIKTVNDESHVLLKVPRKNNMYSVDLKNIVPSGATKDETSGILKSFITRVENLTYQRVKVIRCDNGTEFKNKEMNQFCKRKGKFDGKADEGFFVGYSINSKAFRVFNSRTRIVEENLHVQFRNQSNGNAGAKACDDAGEMETVPGKEYILLPLWPADLLLSQSSKSSLDDGFKPS